MAMIAFGGMITSHSVKNTTNYRVLIIPQSSLSEDPSKMLTIMFPVATVLAAPFAASIVEAIASALPGSI